MLIDLFNPFLGPFLYSASSQLKASPKVSKASQATFAYDTQAIQGPDGQELSFEELRARDWEQTRCLADKPSSNLPLSRSQMSPGRCSHGLPVWRDQQG
jgi:hypothetical protein